MLKTGKYALLCLGILLGITAMVSVTSGQTQDPSEPIKTLNFQAAEIRSVVRFLADYGHVNVVVAPTVQGNVTIALRDVTWKQALEIIGQTYDLAVVYEEAGYIRILPAADYRREMTDIKKYQQEQNTLTDLDTKIIKISNSTSSSIVDAVQSLLSPRGKATADPRTNSIVLQEIPENIDKVIEYISKLDQPPKQIKISAQLLEVNSRSLTELGVNWNLNGYDGSVRPATSPDLFRGADAIAGDGANAGDQVNKTRTSASQNTDLLGTNAAGQFWIRTIQDSWDLEARISALVDDGKGKILAHPEITTIDNSEARIQMGQKVPIKQFDQSGNTVITFEEVGTLLKVTPHITSANKILMHLMPERSTYEYGQAGVIINTNNAETNVVVENGQTAVIGGLTTQDEIENHIGLPILKDIPILGYLFSYKHKEVTNRDLVIFVTPTIVDDYAAVDTENK